MKLVQGNISEPSYGLNYWNSAERSFNPPPPPHDSDQARNERKLYQNRSWCLRCGRPWGAVLGHYTPYRREGQPKALTNTRTNWVSPTRPRDFSPTPHRNFMFPLCTECWSILRIQEREVYYFVLVELWRRQGDDIEWSTIRESVQAGL